MTTEQAKKADERGYRAMLRRTDGARFDGTDISDLVADLLVFAELSGYATADDIAWSALNNARAELDGDEFTTPMGGES